VGIFTSYFNSILIIVVKVGKIQYYY